MDEDKAPELSPKETFLEIYNGFHIYENPRLANGCVEFRDADGNILGVMQGVRTVLLAPRRSV